MQENQLFEYAVIRVVPRVEREEFVNVGVILYCAKQHFLQAMIDVNPGRLQAFCDKLDVPAVEEALRALDRICKGGADAGPRRLRAHAPADEQGGDRRRNVEGGGLVHRGTIVPCDGYGFVGKNL